VAAHATGVAVIHRLRLASNCGRRRGGLRRRQSLRAVLQAVVRSAIGDLRASDARKHAKQVILLVVRAHDTVRNTIRWGPREDGQVFCLAS